MKKSIIVAQDKARAIGGDNKLLWHIPADLKRFKAITMGKPIIMGRKTFQSIGRPLPGRENVVITRNENWSAEGVTVVHSLEQAYDHLADQAEVMVIGGGEIYARALAEADNLYVTAVDTTVDSADTWFPEIDSNQWQEISREPVEAAGETPAYSFVDYTRR